MLIPHVRFQVARNLWIGSAPTPGDPEIGRRFHALLLCAEEYQPSSVNFPHLARVVHVPLDDSGYPLSEREKQLALDAAAKTLDWIRRGKPVLVTCMLGRNRSGLVCALALRMKGQCARHAIEAVREARGSYALSNPEFVRFIEHWRPSLAA